MLEQFKKKFFFYKNKRSKFEVEKVVIWQYFSISGKHRHTFFLIFVLCRSHIKNYIIIGLVSKFFNAPCKRVHLFCRKENTITSWVKERFYSIARLNWPNHLSRLDIYYVASVLKDKTPFNLTQPLC